MKKVPATILPGGSVVDMPLGSNLLEQLRRAGLAPDAPCGGHGTCGKCGVSINGTTVLACQTVVNEAMTVTLPEQSNEHILQTGVKIRAQLRPVRAGKYHLAYDIGTTTMVCYLLDGHTGEELAVASMGNPQAGFGADVISRIQHALKGKLSELAQCVRDGMCRLAKEVCDRVGAAPTEIGTVAVVGNPCMQQLFLGIAPGNLATIPFAPVLTKAEILDAKDYLPLCVNAKLLTVPDISGYVGGDTVACLLANRQWLQEAPTLLVDIGTNGEMVLSAGGKMVACSTAAGPALEGAKIRFGMRGKDGAISRVWLEGDRVRCEVIGGGKAVGICGSGLIDAVAVMLQLGAINEHGRIQTSPMAPRIGHLLGDVDGNRVFYLTEDVYLTQQDIREVQLAKGAIAAGIEMLAQHLRIPLENIGSVQLAGAFGSAIAPQNAVRIGLLPNQFLNKVVAIGNAAGSGAKLLACDEAQLRQAERIVAQTEHLELAASAQFQEIFVENMMFA